MFFQCLNAKIESAEKLAGNTTAEINCDGREAGDQKKEIHAVDYRDTIQESLDYIEDNLDTEITAEELSSRAGFSLFYFLPAVSGAGRHACHAVYSAQTAGACHL